MAKLITSCSLPLNGRPRLGRSGWDEASPKRLFIFAQQSCDVIENKDPEPRKRPKTKLESGANQARRTPDLDGSGWQFSPFEPNSHGKNGRIVRTPRPTTEPSGGSREPEAHALFRTLETGRSGVGRRTTSPQAKRYHRTRRRLSARQAKESCLSTRLTNLVRGVHNYRLA